MTIRHRCRTGVRSTIMTISHRHIIYFMDSESRASASEQAAVKGATDMADYVNLKDQRRMTFVSSSAGHLCASIRPRIRNRWSARR